MAVWAVQLRRGLHFAVAGSPCIELRYYLALVVPTVGPAHTYAIVVQEKPASSPHLQVGYLRRLRLTCPRGSGPSGVRSDAWVGLGWASVIHCRLCFVALHLVSGAPPSTSRAPPPLAKAYSTSSQEAAICRTSLCSLPLKAVECRALVGATLAGIFRFISRG